VLALLVGGCSRCGGALPVDLAPAVTLGGAPICEQCHDAAALARYESTPVDLRCDHATEVGE
jgi:hypothetical protein